MLKLSLKQRAAISVQPFCILLGFFWLTFLYPHRPDLESNVG
uniref:Uncharacterized protein n=1 Tax=Anguilla anguilla TaxID=7936 RepID=A0A0E9WZ62_ANGAN